MGAFVMLKIVLLSLAFVWVLDTAPAEAQRPEEATGVQPLLVGASVPVVSGLVDEQGVAFDLNAALKKQPTVLVFYRGNW
ncbi:MAG: hypothetical protein ACI8P2_001005 [Candidatus Latescibacterota bacterium]|jgi:hypothetical protein